MKFYGGVRGGKNNKWLNFDGDPDQHADCVVPNRKYSHYLTNYEWILMKFYGGVQERNVVRFW